MVEAADARESWCDQYRVRLVGADVRVTLEIDAAIPEGASEQVVRIVTENCKSLKFQQQGFEAE